MFRVAASLLLLVVSPALCWWHPHKGTTWQIQYDQATTDLNVNADVFDLDLYDAKIDSYIRTLHSQGKKVICYFSAGTWEDWRKDTSGTDGALGNTMDEWPNERWWDIRASSVRHVITRRLDHARSIGCDAVDPDNVDGYDPDNNSGLSFTKADSISFLRWMSGEAHDRNLAIGLKNALSVISDVEGDFDFAVNEQCLHYHECNYYRSFLNHNKAVFHIEYSHNHDKCHDSGRLDGMSTLLKNTNLNNWLYACP